MFRVTLAVMELMCKGITEPHLIIPEMTITVLLGISILIQVLMGLNQQIVIMLHHQVIPHQPILHQYIQVQEVVNITTIVMVIKVILKDKVTKNNQSLLDKEIDCLNEK